MFDAESEEDEEALRWLTVPMGKALRRAVRNLEGWFDEFLHCRDWTDGLLGKDEAEILSLPARYSYTREVTRKLAYCLVTVSAKLDAWQSQWAKGEDPEVGCACLAEELMLRAIGLEAERVLADEWETIRCSPEDSSEADWGAFHELAFEDADFEVLFQSGGSDDDAQAALAGLPGTTSMAFRDWFRPFNSTRGVSPLCWEGSFLDVITEQDPDRN